MVFSTLKGWLIQRQKYLQVGAKRLTDAEYLVTFVISDLALLCQQETNDKFPDID